MAQLPSACVEKRNRRVDYKVRVFDFRTVEKMTIKEKCRQTKKNKNREQKKVINVVNKPLVFLGSRNRFKTYYSRDRLI